MTQAELVAALPPGRLPPSMMSLDGGDLLLLFGLGLLVAALVAAVALPFIERRPSRRFLVRATRGLPAEERALAIARILGRMPEELRASAYGAAPPLDDRAIEHIALRRAPRSRRGRG